MVTEKEIIQIAKMYRKGARGMEISKKFKITNGTVYRIIEKLRDAGVKIPYRSEKKIVWKELAKKIK